MLTTDEVVPYLRQRGLLGTFDAAATPPTVVRNAGRNLVFSVETDAGTGFFVKQGFDPDESTGIANEAAAYLSLASENGDQLDRFLPRYVDCDLDRRVIVVELVADAINVREYHSRGHFSVTLARLLGDALGIVHRRGAPARSAAAQAFGTAPPWILSLHRPDVEVLLHASSASVEMIRTLQQYPELGEHLDALRRGWTPSTLIHNDLRWDNCIAFERDGARRRTRLNLVDWELAQVGDPLWDVGCVLGDYLSFWLLSIPIAGEGPPDRFMALSRYPISGMRPAIAAFWGAYLRRAGLPRSAGREWVLDAVRYAAARLIQTGFERSQTASFLSGSVIHLLQLSLNMLDEPLRAADDLLGIGVRESEQR